MDERTKILEAIRVWINQRPGFDLGNYDRAGYLSDSRMVQQQRRDALELLRAVEVRGSINADALKEAFRAFSGRLSWDGKKLDYCAGQAGVRYWLGAALAAFALAFWSPALANISFDDFGPTYTYTFGRTPLVTIFRLRSSRAKARGWEKPANPQTNGRASSPSSTTQVPKVGPLDSSTPLPATLATPAAVKASPSSLQYRYASGSEFKNSSQTFTLPPIGSMQRISWSRCLGETCRHAVSAFRRSASRRISAASFSAAAKRPVVTTKSWRARRASWDAFMARFMALSAASDALVDRSSASASRSLERRVSSPWQSVTRPLASTSPSTPSATSASAMTGPQVPHGDSYGRWTTANPTSITSPTITRPPNTSSAFSSHDTAPSSSSSLALLTPFLRRRRHPTKWGFFWGGIGAGSLIAAVLFLLVWLLAR